MRKTHQIQSQSLFVLLFFITSSVYDYGEYAEHSLTAIRQQFDSHGNKNKSTAFALKRKREFAIFIAYLEAHALQNYANK